MGVRGSAPRTIDLLVIGGGINGTGIARDAAGRGLDVLLCEQDDLAAHSVNRHSILTPDRRAKLTPLSGTAEVVPVVHRGDPRGFV